MMKLDIAHLLIQLGLLVWQIAIDGGAFYIIVHLFLVAMAIAGLSATISHTRGHSSQGS